MKLEWKTCGRVLVTVFGLYLLIHYWEMFMHFLRLGISAATPLIIGCVIAYVANILMSFYEKYYVIICKNSSISKLKRPLCMILAFLSVLLFLVVLIQMIVPELVTCITLLVDRLPEALSNGYEWLEEKFEISKYISDNLDILKNKEFDWESLVRQGGGFLLNGAGGAMSSIISMLSSLVSTLITLFLGFIFSIYLLAGKERLSANFTRVIHTYMSEKAERGFFYFFRTLNHSFHSYIVGQCTEAVILGSLCAVGMLILRLPYASMIGCLVGFMALIPIAGAYIGAAVGTFMIFTVSPVKALIFLVFLAILQQLEGNLIYPRVVGGSIGLPGIWVLAAVTVGGGILGIGGMILAVPLTAAAYQLLKRDLKVRDNRKKYKSSSDGNEAEPKEECQEPQKADFSDRQVEKEGDAEQ